jgi:glycosyl hydrolase family 26
VASRPDWRTAGPSPTIVSLVGRRSLLLVLAFAMLAGAAAGASNSSTEARGVLLGVLGNPARFESLTGQRSRVVHKIVSWDQGHTWGSPFASLFTSMGEMPLLGFGTDRRGTGPISPRAIAFGQGDAFLVAINQAVAAWGRPIYVRPFGEMNGHWTPYSAFDRSGRPRGPTHTTAMFRKAFARVYLIVHGGADTNARLRALGLPPVAAELVSNPFPRVRVIWNPQGYGSPDIPANSAAAYYPGDRYVDVVGNDLYNQGGRAAWEANDKLYADHPAKPYAIVEWANWSIDDAGFIRRMATFVRTHRRVELVSYFHGNPGSPWDLSGKGATRAAYRVAITPLG